MVQGVHRVERLSCTVFISLIILLTAATSEASSTQTNQLFRAHGQYFTLSLCSISLNLCPSEFKRFQCICVFQRVGWLTTGAILVSRNGEPVRKMISPFYPRQTALECISLGSPEGFKEWNTRQF